MCPEASHTVSMRISDIKVGVPYATAGTVSETVVFLDVTTRYRGRHNGPFRVADVAGHSNSPSGYLALRADHKTSPAELVGISQQPGTLEKVILGHALGWNRSVLLMQPGRILCTRAQYDYDQNLKAQARVRSVEAKATRSGEARLAVDRINTIAAEHGITLGAAQSGGQMLVDPHLMLSLVSLLDLLDENS